MTGIIPLLLDGPLMTAHKRRRIMIEQMAEHLVQADAFRERDDAISVLREKDYPRFDIFAFVDEAIALAFQDVVAREMGSHERFS